MASLPEKVDVLIVGAGFSGLYQLHVFRKLGFNVKVVEAGKGLGGTWYWNCYPGARVDSSADIYQLDVDEVWKDWSYSVAFPDWKELREYFAHVDRKLDLRRDITFNTRVTSAEFEESTNEWKVTMEGGKAVRCRFLSMCTGFASKPYIPAFKGLETFRGIHHHTSLWPQDGVDLRGKRVAIIGTGASALQVVQEAAVVSNQVTVFQRTPCIALPMRQRSFTDEEKKEMKEILPQVFKKRKLTSNGTNYAFTEGAFSDQSPDEVSGVYEQLWKEGGFRPLVSGFAEVYTDDAANTWVYEFWRDKVRERVHDPRLKEKLAPMVKPHPFGAKRTPLEQTYYDVFNQANVSLIDVNENDIAEITPNGIKTADGVEHEFDVLVLATGFDAVTGSMIQIDIKGTNGVTVHDKWTASASTYLGLMTANFPNMFFVYAVHGPTALSNGPTALEIQSDWIARCLKHMKDNNFAKIEPTIEAELEWNRLVEDAGNQGLWMKAKSWYNGANIPGKVVQHLNFAGGVALYDQLCREVEEQGYKGLKFTEDRDGLVQRKSMRETPGQQIRARM